MVRTDCSTGFFLELATKSFDVHLPVIQVLNASNIIPQVGIGIVHTHLGDPAGCFVTLV